MIKISELMAKITGTKTATGAVEGGAPTAEQLTEVATGLQTKETELSTKETSLNTKATELATKETELTTKATELATKETSLTTKATELATKEGELKTRSEGLDAEVAEKAAKLSVKGTDPVAPEKKDATKTSLTRVEFNALNAAQKSAFCLAGGKLKD